MWQVAMDLAFLWCKQHKKLISHETVAAAMKKKTRGVKAFNKHNIKVFTKDAGWLRKEPEH